MLQLPEKQTNKQKNHTKKTDHLNQTREHLKQEVLGELKTTALELLPPEKLSNCIMMPL